MQEEELKFKQLIEASDKILVIQADNPDGDSLGSAIALEQILGKLDKHVYLYCAVNIPDYLKYLTGWSRVLNELPSSFDLSIIVDTSSISLLDNLSSADIGALKSRPTIILDHHKTENSIDFADLIINRPVVATGELIYDLTKSLDWQLNDEARDVLATSILADSLGLMNSATTPNSIRVIADLVEAGVNLAHLDSLRRESYRKSLELTHYKGRLLQRIETYLNSRLSVIEIPWEEIEQYSPLYNPSVLVMEDMRLIENSALAVALKIYKDGKITGKIRANYGYPIAGKLAEHFNGGGHDFASGFKTSDFISIDALKSELIKATQDLLDNIDKTKDN